jgi:hypothetical protein
VDEATKAALLDLLDDAVEAGWTRRGACRELELGELRAWRWQQRRAAGAVGDPSPGRQPDARPAR